MRTSDGSLRQRARLGKMRSRSALALALSCAAAASPASDVAAQDARAEHRSVIAALQAIGCAVVSDPERGRYTLRPSTPAGFIPSECFRTAIDAMNVKSAVRLDDPSGALVAETRRTTSGAWPVRRWRCVLGAPAPISLRLPITCSLESWP